MNFYLPDLSDSYSLNKIIIDLLEQSPEKFYDNTKIKAVYGCFPGAIWNGGRLKHGIVTKKEIQSTISYFNQKGVPCRFTWTNCLLENKHLSDTYCNLIMKEADNGMNEITINSEILENYIRNKYPSYKFISSTSKCILDIDEFNKELEKDYMLVVLDYRHNNNEEFLKSIKYRDKVEIVVNEICSPDCKKREDHFVYHSKMQLNFESLNEIEWECTDGADDFYKSFQNETFVTLEDMKKLAEMGFENFKIQGRYGHPVELVEYYIYYMIKPEYREEIRMKILVQIWDNQKNLVKMS